MSFRTEVSGLVALPCLMDSSPVSLGRRMAAVLREEQEKISPDNHLIAVLCDAARLVDELLEIVRGRQDHDDSRGPYAIKWGIFGGPSWPGSREENDLEDALQVAQSNGGTIFDASGNQLTAEDIAAHQRPYRKAAEEIVGTLMLGTSGRLGRALEIHGDHAERIGSWTVESAVVAVERCLEGSGL